MSSSSSDRVTGLASAFEAAKPPEKSGITSIASRFDSPPPQEQPKLQSKISDLASRFSASDKPASPQPSLFVPSSSPAKPSVKSPVKEIINKTPSPTSSSRVSDLSKAFSALGAPAQSETFSAVQSAFEKASKSSSFSNNKGSGDGTVTSKVAGVAKNFESRSKNDGSASKTEAKHGKESTKTSIEHKVDTFANVASRFESGGGGRNGDDTVNEVDAAKERFRDAAKMFGG